MGQDKPRTLFHPVRITEHWTKRYVRLFKTNWKADRTAKKDKFNAQYFG